MTSLHVGSIDGPVKLLGQGVVRELLGAAILCEHDLLLWLAFAQAEAIELPLRVTLALVSLWHASHQLKTGSCASLDGDTWVP